MEARDSVPRRAVQIVVKGFGSVFRVIAIGTLLGLPLAAQVEDRWQLYETAQGSFNSAGQLFKIDTRVAYTLTDHLQVGGGLPVYLVRSSEQTRPLGPGWNAGIGNAYVDFRMLVNRPEWSFSSDIRAAAPTGDRQQGFSTGKTTVDWTNAAALYLSQATLFGSAGMANTVADTAFFVRPFTTDGLVGHFDGGVFLPFHPNFGLGFVGYAVRGGGTQEVLSRLVDTDVAPPLDRRRGFETQVETRGEDLADDHGFSTWLDITSGSGVSVQVGYTRSVPYAYDTAFFSIGFDAVSLLR